MEISIIAAVSMNGVIGRAGTIPWDIKADKEHFKELTTGKISDGKRNAVIMGRRTWQTIGHPLAGRTAIILTRKHNNTLPRSCSVQEGMVLAAGSLAEALCTAEKHGAPVAWIAGGEGVYREALPLCQRLCITEVLANTAGDAYFPDFDKMQYTKEESPLQSCGGNLDGAKVSWRYVTYTRWLLRNLHSSSQALNMQGAFSLPPND